jgi:hypothetical protein
VEHTDVGAYALGLLEEHDKRAFEEHLYECPSCRNELTEFAVVAGALSGLGPLEDDLSYPQAETSRAGEDLRTYRDGRDLGRAEGSRVGGSRRGGGAHRDGEAEVVDLARHKRTAGRRTRKGTVIIGLAAAVTLVAGGLTIGMQIGAGNASPSTIAQGTNPGMSAAEQLYTNGTPFVGAGANGVSGGLVVESKAWGTRAALKLSGVAGPLECELVSVSTSGVRRVMTGWSVPKSGYGVPGQPNPLFTEGGSAQPLAEIDHFEVVTSTGKKLLTVDV